MTASSGAINVPNTATMAPINAEMDKTIVDVFGGFKLGIQESVD